MLNYSTNSITTAELEMELRGAIHLERAARRANVILAVLICIQDALAAGKRKQIHSFA
jgi:hypothetical protein